MHPLVNIAVSAAQAAGQIIQQYAQQLDRIKIKEKDNNDVVSDADLKAEQIIIQTIRKSYPNHSIIAEESGEQGHDEEFTWLIDPIDGTTNFIHGLPYYAISIAVKVKNRIEHAVVYDPARMELFTASRGQGATLNNKRIRVNKTHQFSKALIGTSLGFKTNRASKLYLDTVSEVMSKCASIRRGGAAALDLAYVAAGRLDGALAFNLNAWDIAAGSLLIKEAGGLVCDTNGLESYLNTGNLIAGNPKTLKSLLQLVKPIIDKQS